MTYTLFGMAGSLYTARARSYMRTNAVPFTEVKAGSEEFLGKIVPQIGRWIIPVIKTTEGSIIQDGADIIDHLDAAGFSKKPIYPADPKLLVIAHLFELFGSHGLLRPAMHYRWNFDDVNLPFLRETFRDVLPSGLPKEAEDAAFLHASGRMRKAAEVFGVNPQTYNLVEESYAQFLSLMEQHLRIHPFILGGHPTIADYGLIGAMYAHLGRDPAPLHLMQTRAPNVFRWVERMNMAETFVDGAMASSDGELIDSETLPDSLFDLMRFISEDYLAEITAHVERANSWLERHPDIETGSSTNNKSMKSGMGLAPFAWRGAQIETVVIPYRFCLLQRLHDAFEAQSTENQGAIRTTLQGVELDSLLDLKTNRRIERHENDEIWGEKADG
ncbi:glutathione S-transferase C-terminal domain-containing protein [uncultured Erythrobacter sp.]|uniref:glutathione S-transferase family protein n=1 Tax=uncultured Erythrobacter sp. TaxID=263913 RepID=UPI00263886E2|nr:glutathione S-transferase C-terminal domain-containing protein [uncultured Erythrobacter sp.]